jgi:hypothetical protein
MTGVDFTKSLVILPNFEGTQLKDACFKEEQLKFIKLDGKQKKEIRVIPNEAAAATQAVGTEKAGE